MCEQAASKRFIACFFKLLLFVGHVYAAGKAGDTLIGYKFVSDVTGYYNIAKDVCDMNKLTYQAHNFAAAKTIYQDGRYVPGLSTRSLANNTSYANEELWGLFTKYYANETAEGTTWLDTYVSAAFDNTSLYWKEEISRAQVINKGSGSGVQGAYMFHELQTAIDKAAAGDLDNTTGAPHHIDTAWALYASDSSGRGESGCSLLSVPEKRNHVFGTSVQGTCDSIVATEMSKAFNAAQQAAQSGDVTTLTALRDEMLRLYTITYLQGVIQYIHVTETALQENKPVEGLASEAYTFYWVIEPLLARVNQTAANEVSQALKYPELGLDVRVEATLQQMYGALNISKADVGEFTTAPQSCTLGSALLSSEDAASSGFIELTSAGFNSFSRCYSTLGVVVSIMTVMSFIGLYT